MKIMQVLEALTQPVTINEIEEITGLEYAQIKQALKTISLEIGYRKMGYGSNIHYYAPKHTHPSFRQFQYRTLLNLIDTDEWWTMHEICMLLEMIPREVGTCIAFINRSKKAKIIFERYDGSRCRYKVVK